MNNRSHAGNKTIVSTSTTERDDEPKEGTPHDCDAKHTYAVKLTDEGRKVAEKRVAANDKTAEDILDCLSADEVAQLNALTEKLILSCKDKGINGKKKGRKAHSCHCC